MKVQRATADVDRATPMTNKHAISPHDTTQQREAMSKAIARETNTGRSGYRAPGNFQASTATFSRSQLTTSKEP